MRLWTMTTLLLLIVSATAWGQTTVQLRPEKDNTLYEDTTGNTSNGLGQYMFAGRTAAGSNEKIRRAVIQFDIAGNIPSNATITQVTLTLNMSRTQAGTETVDLHRLTTDWGEGSSNASGQEGGGTQSTLNDATWIHNFFSSSQWNTAGGDFTSTASASQSVGGIGTYTWSSGQLVTDVQDMLDNPNQNYGWVLIGNESTGSTAKRFDTKDHPTANNRPELEITYTLPPTPNDLVINEVDYDMPGTDSSEFIELRNNDNVAIDLSLYAIELVNGSGGGAIVYQTINLPSDSLQPGDYYVICANNSRTPHCDLDVSPSINLIQNGAPDAIGLKFNGTTVIDAVSYEGNTANPYREISGTNLIDNSSTANFGLSRFPDGQDSDFNNQDFDWLCITPGAPNGPPVVNISPANAAGVCPGDTVTLTAQGALGTLQWYKNGVPIDGATDSVLAVDTPGLYNVESVIGFCSDTANLPTEVFFLPVPQVDLGPDTTVCSFYRLDAENFGADYAWNTGSQSRTLNVSQSGTYSVTVTDNGCSAADTVTVNIGSPFSIFLPNIDSGCDSLLLDPGNVNNAHYSWSTGDTSATLTVSQSGKYWVDVERVGCFQTDTVLVTIDTTPQVQAGLDQSGCDSVQFTATVDDPTGVNIFWSNGSSDTTITVFNSGFYIVEAERNGCTDFDTAEATIFPPTDVVLPFNQSDCDSVTLQPITTAQTFLWNTGDTTEDLTVFQSGVYYVTVANSFGCQASDSVTVTIFGRPDADLGPDTTSCVPVTLTAPAANADYFWSTGDRSRSISVTSSGVYTVEVEENGCFSRDTIEVTIVPQPVVDLGADTSVCGEFLLDPRQQGDYQWSTGATSPAITVSQSGTYSVTVTAGTCSDADTITLQVTPAPDVSIGPDTTHCGPLSLTADLAGSYTWNTGDTLQSIIATQSGAYSVTVVDQGCVSIDSAHVIIDSLPTVTLGADTALCGDRIVITAGPGSQQYNWNTGSTGPSLAVTQSGTYIVTVTSLKCAVIDTQTVTLYPEPVLQLGPDVTACNQTQLTGNVAGVYQWSTGASQNPLTVTSTGTYSAVVTDSNGCTAQDTVDVTILVGPAPDLGPDRTICDSVLLDAGMGDTYQWSTGSNASTLWVKQAGLYAVTVSNNNGCVDTDTVQLALELSPEAAFTMDTVDCPTFAFFTQSTGSNLLYEWNFGDGNSATTPDATHTFPANNQYNIWHVARNLCGTDTMRMVLQVDCIPDGIPSLSHVGAKLFPNPAQQHVTLYWPLATTAWAEVYNAQGQRMGEWRVSATTVIGTQEWPSGWYWLRLRFDDQVVGQPLIIQR